MTGKIFRISCDPGSKQERSVAADLWFELVFAYHLPYFDRFAYGTCEFNERPQLPAGARLRLEGNRIRGRAIITTVDYDVIVVDWNSELSGDRFISGWENGMFMQCLTT